jgi:prepilin-type N-terminal cleavage/methylation domain-containing protein
VFVRLMKYSKINAKGFTLIEVIVVIAITVALMVGLMFVLNPKKRLNQGNDAKIRNDIDEISIALESFNALKHFYPLRLSDLVDNGDLKTLPLPPHGGGIEYTYTTNAACAAAPYTGCEATLQYALRDPAAVGNVWCWQSKTGTAKELAVCPAP